MPSYQYTRDIKPDDLKPEQPPELHGKKKAKNWWHYHWKLVAVIGVVLVLVASLVFEILRNTDPDYTLGVLCPTTLPNGLNEKLEAELGGLISETLGTDAAKTAGLEVYTIYVAPEGLTEEEADAHSAQYNVDYYAQMAGVTQLSGAFSDTKVMLFLLYEDMAEDYIVQYDMLAGLDFAGGAETLRWADVPALAGLDLTFEIVDGQEYDGQLVMGQFVIGLRALDGTKYAENESATAAQSEAYSLLRQWAGA